MLRHLTSWLTILAIWFRPLAVVRCCLLRVPWFILATLLDVSCCRVCTILLTVFPRHLLLILVVLALPLLPSIPMCRRLVLSDYFRFVLHRYISAKNTELIIMPDLPNSRRSPRKVAPYYTPIPLAPTPTRGNGFLCSAYDYRNFLLGYDFFDIDLCSSRQPSSPPVGNQCGFP